MEKSVEKLIREMRPRVESIVLKQLFSDIIDRLLKMLLVMKKTPNQVEIIVNDFINLIGLKGEYIDFFKKLFDSLLETEKEKFSLSEPLSEENYNALLFSLATEILNNSFLKDEVRENKDDTI